MDHRRETATSTTDQEDHQEVIDRHLWAGRAEPSRRADVLALHLADMGAAIEVEAAGAAEEASAVVETTTDTALDAHFLVLGLDHQDGACRILLLGQEPHRRGAVAAAMGMPTDGGIPLLEEVVAVGGAQAIVLTAVIAVVGAGAGAGAEGGALLGDSKVDMDLFHVCRMSPVRQ